ncbi:MAG: DNA repair protein [Propionibacterium sp.]|nr:MAG: DNA repair protein [Propionibacterium sp.]
MNSSASPATFGRVEADGTVYVRTADGERSVGQVPDVTPEEALAFFTRRFENLQVEVQTLASRVEARTVSPDDARKALSHLREAVASANAVGDLDSLSATLDGLVPQIDQIAAERKEARKRANEQALAAKQTMVEEAERIAAGDDWRGGVDRFRKLLEEWKKLPRIDRSTDDALWHRFSSARTTYTRRRKAQFAEQAEIREASRVKKEKILAEAQELASSTDWGPTSGAFRDLMARWKAAGPAPRAVDEQLWNQFRAAQDQFFSARNAAQNEMNAEQTANLEAKEALLAEAEETILPVVDFAESKEAFRAFLTKYHQIGHVPRNAIRALDSRVRAIESAIRDAEEAEWRRTDPEARKRAEDTIAMFSEHISKLEAKLSKAEAAGDKKAIKDAQDSIAIYASWLEQAQETLNDFKR